MMTDAEPSALDLVYAAKSPEALAAAYSRWAERYERETLELGYCLPFVVTAWLARFVAPGDGEVLDAGCGTGLSGPVLKALGYGPLCGMDMSPAMLAAANVRDCYDRLVEAELGKPLPFKAGRFAAFISGGVFTAGHAPAASLRDLAVVLKAGGHGVFTIRESIFESGGFDAVLAELVRSGVWTPVERSEPFRAFAIAEPEVLVRTHVFRRV